MPSFSIGAFELNENRQSSFDEFISLVKGRSIISAANWGQDRFELGVSGGAMIRFFTAGEHLEINVISTVNENEIPPLIFSLGDMPQRVPISTIEKKLYGLRTLYAIYYLAHNNRLQELTSYLIRHPHGDIEKALLKPDETLHIESISYGSWMLAVWGQSKKAYKALSSVAGLVFERGRQAYLKKLEAEARLIEAKAKKEEISAASDEFDLKRKQLDYLFKVSKQIGIPEVQENLERIMIKATSDLLYGDPEKDKTHQTLTGVDDSSISDAIPVDIVKSPRNQSDSKAHD